jgi:tight adherence protein B
MSDLDWILLVAGIGGILAILGLQWTDWRRSRKERQALDRMNVNAAADSDEDRSRWFLTPLQRRLRAAGFPDSRILYFSFICILAAFIALWVMELFRGLWVPTVIAFGLSLSFLHLMVGEIARVRSIRFEEKLVNAVDLMISALRSGENPTQAMASSAAASPNPVRREFSDVVNRLGIGMPIRRSVAGMMSNYDSEGVRLFCNTLIAKWSVGGDFAPVLNSVNRIMRERLRHRLHLRSQLAGAQVSSVLVALAPYALLIGFYFQRPQWLERLMNHPVGSALLFSAIALQLFGFLWLQRMLRVEL